MANPDHLRALNRGVDFWNNWRTQNSDICPDLSGVDLSKQSFRNANFASTNLRQANLCKAQLRESDFTGANLEGASLQWAVLSKTKLVGATLRQADLDRSSVRWANATRADFTGANLKYASFVGTNLEDALLSRCSIYGISVWNLEGTPKEQNELVITDEGESPVLVDNLEVAQFIYLLLNNQKIRHVIDTITSKVSSSLDASLQSARPSWMPFGTNSASGTTCQSCSISTSRRTGISPRRFPRWRTWHGSSLLTSPMRRASRRS